MAKTNPTNGPSVPALPAGVGDGKKAKKVKSGVREKLVVVWHPDMQPDAEGNPTAKLKGWPTDYKTTKHKPLSLNHFEDPAVFYIGKAEKLEKLAANYRQQATESKAIGGVKEKASAKKLFNFMKRVDDLKLELASKGVNVEEMLKLIAEKAKPAEGEVVAPPTEQPVVAG